MDMLDRIIALIASYEQEHDRSSPTGLYLGYEEYLALMQDSKPGDWRVDLYGKPVRVYGVPVYKVNEPHHFNVGWATQPKEKT